MIECDATVVTDDGDEAPVRACVESITNSSDGRAHWLAALEGRDLQGWRLIGHSFTVRFSDGTQRRVVAFEAWGFRGVKVEPASD